MKRLRPLAALLFVLFITVQAAHIPAAADASGFSFALGSQDASAGEVVALKLQVNGSMPAAGFRVRVSYDDSVLQFENMDVSSRIETGTLQTNSVSNPIYSVYVCSTDKGSAPTLSGTILTYLFRVKSNAEAGETDLCACIDEICDYSGKSLDLDHFSTLPLNIRANGTSQPYLTALEPSQGTLNPAFSSDIFDYNLSVDSGVRSVTFRADAADGASVRVSRKSLNEAGTDTTIIVTVTSADKKEQAEYYVVVSRAEKINEVHSEDTRSPNSRGQTADRTKNQTKKTKVNDAAEKALAAAKTKKKKSAANLSGTVNTRMEPSAAQENTVQNTPAAAGNVAQSAPGLTMIQDRMPAYFIGLLAAGFCITAGIALCLWFTMKKK